MFYTRTIDQHVWPRSVVGSGTRFPSPIDPGPDGRLGTSDDTGRSITYYEYPTSLGNAASSKTMITNNRAADATYKTFEIAATKRPAQGWQVGASYSTTWSDVPIACGVSGGGLGSGTPLVWFPIDASRIPTSPSTRPSIRGVAGQAVGSVQPAVRFWRRRTMTFEAALPRLGKSSSPGASRFARLR